MLNTVLGREPWQLASLIFHELAHQVVYVQGDTTFNESFATAVEQHGLQRWLLLRRSVTHAWLPRSGRREKGMPTHRRAQPLTLSRLRI